MRKIYPYILVAALGFCPLTAANAMGMKSLAAAGERPAAGKSEVIDVSYKRGCYKRFSERQNRYIRVCDHRYKRYRHSRYRYYRYYDFYPPYYYGYGPSAYFAFPGLNFYFSAPFHRHHHHHRHFKKRYKHY
jgi:hypothetical protein